MPHYTDFSGRFAEIPGGSGEFWGYFDSKADAIAGSAVVDWSTFASNSPPAAVAQIPNLAF